MSRDGWCVWGWAGGGHLGIHPLAVLLLLLLLAARYSSLGKLRLCPITQQLWGTNCNPLFCLGEVE